MLKNKNAIYLLIPLNIAVWGFFSYRIFGAFSGEGELVNVEKTERQLPAKLESDSVSYTLALNYKDPFLKEGAKEPYYSQRSENRSAPTKKVAPVNAAFKVEIAKPAIKFLGIIKNSTTGTTTALVSINGLSKLIKPNETVDGIVFKTMNSDSIVAKIGKERLVIRR